MILRVTAPIPPGLLAINARDKVARATLDSGAVVPVIRKAASYRAAQNELTLFVRQECIRTRWRPLSRLTPCWSVVRSFWPEDKGDVDACSKAALDGFKSGGAIADDDQVQIAVLERVWRSAIPRIELVLTTTFPELVSSLGWTSELGGAS